jgi:rhodanese-related sulfurtransferase
MSELIDRSQVRSMLAENAAQVVEVLPPEEYESAHIAGAISLPLSDLEARAAGVLDRDRPVIVYCDDYQ